MLPALLPVAILFTGFDHPDSSAQGSDTAWTVQEIEKWNEENLLEQFETESDDLQVLDELTWRKEHPFDLNTVTQEELETIPDILPQEAAAIIKHRNVIRTFRSIQQLREIKEEGEFLYGKLAPYVIVDRVQEVIQARTRAIRDLQPRKADANGTFLGPPFKTYNRASIVTGDFQTGALFEKDAGEQFTDGFVSGYLMMNNIGIASRVLVGDFVVNSGQGLALWRSGAFGKGSQTVSIVRKSGTGVQPYRSTDEFNFFRGIAATGVTRIDGGQVEAVAFYSRHALDGSVDSSGSVTSFYTDGLFRTPGELQRRRTLLESLLGGRIAFLSDGGWGIGATGYRSRLDRPVVARQAHDFEGNQMGVASVDGSALFGRISVFGELARSTGGGLAGVVGSVVDVSTEAKLAVVFRNYEPSFFNIHATAFGEHADARNERGVYLGVDLRPARWMHLSGYADQFWFPWRTFFNPLPTRGHEVMLNNDIRASRNVDFGFRIIHKTTEQTIATIDPLGRAVRPLADRTQDKYRVNLGYRVNPRVRIKGRLEFTQVRYSPPASQESGLMMYQDIWIRCSERLTLEVRLAFFQTDSYDSRIYEFESDVQGSFSNPGLYGRGRRWYTIARWQIVQGIRLSAKYSEIQKEGVSTLGSGSTEVAGDLDNRITLQLDVSL